MKFSFVFIEAESYAIMLLSSILKRGGHYVDAVYDPRLFNTDEISNSRLARFFDVREKNIRHIQRVKPDYVGFSVYTQDYQYCLEYARRIKSALPDTKIIFGGIHPTLCPDEVLANNCVDMICVGEGEESIIELARGVWPIYNIWTKKTRTALRPLISDLDKLPRMDRDLLYDLRPVFKDGYTISTSRGCPNQCTFCASVALGNAVKGLGRYVRQRSPENVIDELQWAILRFHPKNIYFTDDVMVLNMNWLRHFVELYKMFIKLPFYCTANPGTISLEAIPLLKEAGCQMIGFGLQSCNEKVRMDLLHRRGTNERIASVSRECKRNRIYFSYDHIFDLPDDNSDPKEAIKFYNETRPDVINTFTMTYLPRIELNRYLDKKTVAEVNNGKIRTGMFNRNNDYCVSVFSILPLLPRTWIDFLCRKNLARFIRLPYPIRLFLKDLKRAMIGRWSDILFPIRLYLVNIKECLYWRYFSSSSGSR
ncbi:MAG TPA: cobalamin-dependent protein [Candidatus Omnitrophota bacterium]|nr:cobalamin-dependent protein [Candidatus Omnitrophota bacterium]